MNAGVGIEANALFERVRQRLAAADASDRFSVLNPATGEVLANVPNMGATEASRAIGTAAEAFVAWRAKLAQERAHLLRRWHGLILEHQEQLARLLTAEQGKPLTEARGEVLFAASFVEWFAEEGKRAYGDIIPTNAAARRLLVLKQPVGVVAAITPWNFPSAMVTRKVAPALAAGCCVVLKPAEDTPLSALALEALAEDAGIPKGVFQVVTSDQPQAIAKEFTANATVRKLSFTGSTRVGKLLMRDCADTVKKVSLELGGNAPFIIFDDANLDEAVKSAMLSKFRNAGQTCVSANRFLVQASVLAPFLERFRAAIAGLTVGDGFEPGVQVGPLINTRAVDRVSRLVDAAVGSGASAAVGGRLHARGGNFYAPTLLTGISLAMDVVRSEIFGPVATVMPFESEDDAIRLANDTPYGLAAYFWTGSLKRAWRITEGLEYGMVGVNEGMISSEAAPFGGVKESGIGREGSKYGLDEYLELKYAAMGGL